MRRGPGSASHPPAAANPRRRRQDFHLLSRASRPVNVSCTHRTGWGDASFPAPALSALPRERAYPNGHRQLPLRCFSLGHRLGAGRPPELGGTSRPTGSSPDVEIAGRSPRARAPTGLRSRRPPHGRRRREYARRHRGSYRLTRRGATETDRPINSAQSGRIGICEGVTAIPMLPKPHAARPSVSKSASPQLS